MSDFNGDGYIDAVDTDGDGYLDTYDTNFDGFADTFDLDEDGVADGSGYDSGYGGTDVDGDGLVDDNPNTYLDDDAYYTEAQQAQGYSASDTSFIEPPSAAGSSSLIS